MSSLILPSRRIAQPDGFVEVDWSNPLTRGLVSAGTAAGKLDVVRRVPARSHIYKASRHGIVAPNNSFWPPVNFDANYVSIPANSGFTVIVVVPAAALVGSNPGVMRSGSYAAYAAGTGSTFCIVQGGGVNRPWVRLNGVDVLKPASGGQLVAGSEYVLAYSVSSASSAKVAWNGAIRHQTTHSTPTPSFSIYGLGAQNAVVESIGGLSAFAIYDRALNDEELIEVTRTGWQIFKPVTRRIYFDVGAGAPAGAVLEGAATGVASASGSLTTGIPIAGAALAVASASGALSVGIPLAGAAASMSTASGSLAAQITLAGSALAQAVSSALLSTGIVMTADAVAQAAADGTLETAIQLLGSAQAQAAAAGDLTTGSGGLEGHAQASASAAASLTTAIRLEAAALAEAIATGNLAGASAHLAGSAVSVATADGALTVNVALTAQALASAIAQGSLTTEIRLAADAAAAAQAGAQLSGGSAMAARADILLAGRRYRTLRALPRQRILRST